MASEETRQRTAAAWDSSLTKGRNNLIQREVWLRADEREDLARFILRIKHHLGVTMIWIEHDLQMVADLAERIHVLDYGRTLAEGPPTQVLRDPRVVAAYVGTVER